MGPDERLTAPERGAGAQRPAAVLIARLRARLAAGDGPLFVGIDGRSGVGKSTLAALVSEDLAEPCGGAGHVTVIEGDDFYAGGSAEAWDRWTAAEAADRVIDWRRQRDVLAALRGVGVAAWHPFDWDAEDWDGDIVPLVPVPTVARVAPVVVVEGAYSCRPELHDLLDLRVLLDAPLDVRRRRLLEREGDAHQDGWEARWATAEDRYFGTTMPPERFDLVLGPP
jgi:para-aminobenzoate synthetase